MSAGFATLTGGLLGTPIASSGLMTGSTVAAANGVTLTGIGEAATATTANVGAGGVLGGTVSGVGTTSAAALPTATTAASKTILGRIGSALTSDTVGGSVLRTGIVAGINGGMRKQELEAEDERFRATQFFGGPIYGGGTDGLVYTNPLESRKPVIDQTKAAPFEVFKQNTPNLWQPPTPPPTTQMTPRTAQNSGAGGLLSPLPAGSGTQPPPTQTGQGTRPPGGVELENLGVG